MRVRARGSRWNWRKECTTAQSERRGAGARYYRQTAAQLRSTPAARRSPCRPAQRQRRPRVRADPGRRGRGGHTKRKKRPPKRQQKCRAFPARLLPHWFHASTPLLLVKNTLRLNKISPALSKSSGQAAAPSTAGLAQVRSSTSLADVGGSRGPAYTDTTSAPVAPNTLPRSMGIF
jgi:hypothetical protein